MALASVFVIVVAGVTAWLLSDRLVNQTTEVATSTGEVLIATQQVRASFAEADTAATSVHLAGADGNREQRRLYEQAVDRATSSLEDVARLVGDDEPSHEALQDVAARTTEYAGLIEAARLASVQDLDGADQTLSEASEINRTEISRDVQAVADRARARFDEQTGSTWYIAAIVSLLVALLVLLFMQFRLHRQFHRTINVPMALATIVLLVLTFMSYRAFVGQQRAFNQAENDAFDAISVSEDIQQIAYRHRAVGTASVLGGSEASEELLSLRVQLEADGGLLPLARTEASSIREQAAADEVTARWERYVAESDRMQDALVGGDIELAEEITQGSANAAFNGFNTTVEAALLDNREQFLGELQTASDALNWLRGTILVGTLLAALLTWWGFGLRIGEYR